MPSSMNHTNFLKLNIFEIIKNHIAVSCHLFHNIVLMSRLNLLQEEFQLTYLTIYLCINGTCYPPKRSANLHIIAIKPQSRNNNTSNIQKSRLYSLRIFCKFLPQRAHYPWHQLCGQQKGALAAATAKSCKKL